MIINPENVTLSKETAIYTGKAVKNIEPIVKINDTLLEKNKHYKVQYKNNTNAGDAYIIITGKGQYKGKVVKSFTITPLKTELTIKEIPQKTYNGKLQKPTLTVKAGKQNYTRWSAPVTSYLTENDNGTVTRVEYIKDKVYVETYSTERKLLDQKKILVELPLFGGFYAGKNNNFLVFGQNNPNEDGGVEVIRVVKYDKDWNRQGAASLFGANTAQPFWAGSLSITECGDMLYVRTCHKMYKSEDGLNHQANLTMSVNTSNMKITDQMSIIWNIAGGYVSHSFNQHIITDGEDLLAVDHGDAHPRSVVLVKYAARAGKEEFTGYCDNVDVLPIQGKIGANDTGVSLGGLASSDTAYLVAGNSVAQNNAEKYNASGVRNIFVTSTKKIILRQKAQQYIGLQIILIKIM